MSRSVKTVIILGSIFLVLGIVIVTTHILDTYRISSPGTSPGLEPGQVIFSSNLITTKRYDYVVFRKGHEDWCKQAVGLEGDVIEFIDGRLHVNGRDMDDSLPTKFQFVVSLQDYENLKQAEYINDFESYPYSINSAMIFIQEDTIKKLGIRYEKIMQAKNVPDTAVTKTWKNTTWNSDYFGPVKVPKGKIFVAGNSRKNSLDSRYIGLIDTKDVLSVVFW